jgi:tetratricopeptide (TPR) repeat protein
MALNKYLEEANRYSKKISLFHVIILSCFFALISVFAQHSGSVNIETEVRLPFYLSDIPLLNKIFDSQIIEGDRFRARELSYVLDYIDSRFIEWGIENGFPHFLSLTHYLFSIMTGCLLWLFCVKELKLGPLTGIGLLMLFWTSPSVFWGGSYFRAAKIAVAFLAAVLFYVIYRAAVISAGKSDSAMSKKLWLVYGAAVFLITFLDEQGLFFAFIVIAFLILWGLFFRNRNVYIMLAMGIAGVALHMLYRYILAPKLMFIVNGFRPSFDYQALSIASFIRHIDSSFSAGFYLYLETIRFLIGTPPRFAALGLLLLFVMVPAYRMCARFGLPDHDKKVFVLAFIELLIINFLLVIMNSIMFFRNPLIVWPDITRTYYFLPMTIVLAMTLAVLADVFRKSKPTGRLFTVIICLTVAGNLAALPKHRDIIREGQEPYIQRSQDLLSALKNIDSPDRVRDPFVRQNLVFKFFKSRKDIPPAGHTQYHEQGIYYAERGQYRKAIDNFTMAVMQNPDNLQFRLSRAYVYYKLSDYQQAINDLNEVILKKPDYAEAYSNRGFAYLNQGNIEQGCRDAQKACKLGNCALLEKTKTQGICGSGQGHTRQGIKP